MTATLPDCPDLSARTLADWLHHIESLYPRTIELGLERVHAVLDRTGLRQPPFAIITVAGTNGKGSTVGYCEAALRAGGYRVGSYTSPHLIRYNERVCIDGTPVDDDALCAAFARVEAYRGELPLTYFEYGTVVALEILRQRGVAVAVLEVGMGGRLDAVNAVDADVAVVTSIGIDHAAWLGNDRETIGREKAGVFRAQRPAICSDPTPPASIEMAATAIGARLLQLGRDFRIEREPSGWSLRYGERLRTGLPYPVLRGDHQLHNAAGALMALEAMADRFPLSQAAIRQGLLRAQVAGRFQVLPGQPAVVLDVAHNPAAAEALAQTLAQQPVAGRTLAVFGMLLDKDIAGVARALDRRIDRWYLTALPGPRAATTAQLEQALTSAGVRAPRETYPDPQAAFAAARRAAAAADRIVVFGSFYTVGGILAGLGTTSRP